MFRFIESNNFLVKRSVLSENAFKEPFIVLPALSSSRRILSNSEIL